MSTFLEKLRRLFARTPPSPADAAEAARLRAEVETVRLSQTRGAGSAGQNYQSGRGSS